MVALKVDGAARYAGEAAVALVLYFTRSPKDTPPKDPPPVPPAAMGLFVLAFAGLGALVLPACAYLHDQKVEAENAYLAEQLACVEKSATKEESQKCREAVREKWAIQD